MINPLVCRSQHRSSVGAVAMGHRDWALQLEMTEWQVHARFKVRRRVWRRERVAGAGTDRQWPGVAQVQRSRGRVVVLLGGWRQTSNKEERMFSRRCWKWYRLPDGSGVVRDGLELSEDSGGSDVDQWAAIGRRLIVKFGSLWFTSCGSQHIHHRLAAKARGKQLGSSATDPGRCVQGRGWQR